MFAYNYSVKVLHSLVSSVERQSASASGCPLIVHCKNFQVLHFVIPHERDCHDVLMSLQRLSQPGKLLFIQRKYKCVVDIALLPASMPRNVFSLLFIRNGIIIITSYQC